MKHKRIVIALVLLVSLLLSSCGQAFPRMTQTALLYAEAAPKAFSEPAAKAEEEKAPEPETAAEAPALLSAFREAPADVQTVQPMAPAGGKVEPVRVTTDMFRAKFEGSAVSGSGEAVGGVYRFAATQTDGEAWHVKLECNYPTVAGRDYRISYRFHSDVAGKVKFGDFQEFEIREGDNSLTGILTASSGTSYLDLQLGMLPPFTIDFSEIEVEEYADEVDYENALPSPVNFERETLVFEKHDQGYAPVLTRSKDGVSVEYLATSWDSGIWKSRLYIRTGLIPESGVHYRVTADIKCDQDMPFEVLFNNGDEEKGYGALYGQNLTAGETKTCEAVITGSGDGDDLVMQFSLGEVPEGSVVDVSNLRVEKIKDHYTSVLPALFALDTSVETGKILYGAIPTSYKNLPMSFSYSGTDTVWEGHDDGYEVSLEESASSATLKITKAPADRNVFGVKLFAATGVTLEAGTTYRIKYDLASTDNQSTYEACFDGSTEKAYGALYGRSLTAGGTDHVEYTVTPDASNGPLTLRLQLGETDTTAGNTVTLSNLSIEKVTAEYKEVGTADFDGTATADFWAHDAYYDGSGGAELTPGDGFATLKINNPPSEGLEVWKVKLFFNNVAALEAGKQYLVSVDVEATNEFDYEICYNDQENGNGEKALGALYERKAKNTLQTETYTVTPSADKNLSLQFNLGLADKTTTVTVSNIKVQEVLGGETAVPVSITYPNAGATYINQFSAIKAATSEGDNWAVNTVSSSDASQATINIGTAADGIWKTRLHVNTGVVLEPNMRYRVAATLHSEKPIGFEVLYSNGSEENDGYNPGGQGYNDGSFGLHADENGDCTVTKTFVVPQRSEYKDLVLRFQLGNSPVPNNVTVSGISVEKWTPDLGYSHNSMTPDNYPPVFLETNSDTTAVLTGDGNSATATVLKKGLDWNIKLYASTGATLTEGHNYKIGMTIDGAEGWGIAYKIGNGEEVVVNDKTVSGSSVSFNVTPGATGRLQLVLKLGAVAEDSSVTLSGISVTEVVPDGQGENIASVSQEQMGFFVHDDYKKGKAGNLTASGTTAELEILAPPADDRANWKVKLFLNTGIALTAGKDYRISADVSSDKELEYAICYTDGVNDTSEHQVADTKSGLHAASSAQTVVCNASPTADATLNLQLNLGLAPEPCTVTVSNVKVEEVDTSTAESVLPSFSYDSTGNISRAADDGYETRLEQGSSSATLYIDKAPSSDRNPWNVKFNIRTGLTPEKNKGYRVSFDLNAAKAQNAFEIFYDGSSESAYGSQYNLSLAAGKNSFSYIIYPGESKGELVLQLRCGKTNGTDGNAYTFSNLKIEEVTFRYTQTPEVKEVTTLVTQNGYIEQLERTRDRATVRIEKTPSEGREAWKSKLFVETGVTLRPGQKYRVSMDVKSIIPTPFEVCFNNGGVEKGLGAMFGLISTPSGQHVEYITYAKEATQLVIQLSLGNCAPPNSIMLSNVKVEKAGAIDLVSDTIYTF